MTRKLTDEQVQAIRDNFPDNDWVYINVIGSLLIGIMPSTEDALPNTIAVYLKNVGAGEYLEKDYFETPDEAIAYAEHLLNQRYCWLPQNNGWIMSGEIYNFANNGANKVLELIYLSLSTPFDCMDNWYTFEGRLGNSLQSSVHYVKGITIPADSPIWDAVKEAEV
jgi:hypothetical protein